MNHYLVRVELHYTQDAAKKPNFDDLHILMARQQLTQYTYNAVRGNATLFHLPHAEYIMRTDDDVFAVKKIVSEVCQSFWTDFTVLVTQIAANGDALVYTWENLKPVQDPEALADVFHKAKHRASFDPKFRRTA